jgi:hypothetical protein
MIPHRNVVYAPQQVHYMPQPPAPPMPFEKVFVMAVVLGMGAVGMTAGVIGIFKVSEKRGLDRRKKRLIHYLAFDGTHL